MRKCNSSEILISSKTHHAFFISLVIYTISFNCISPFKLVTTYGYLNIPSFYDCWYNNYKLFSTIVLLIKNTIFKNTNKCFKSSNKCWEIKSTLDWLQYDVWECNEKVNQFRFRKWLSKHLNKKENLKYKNLLLMKHILLLSIFREAY